MGLPIHVEQDEEDWMSEACETEAAGCRPEIHGDSQRCFMNQIVFDFTFEGIIDRHALTVDTTLTLSASIIVTARWLTPGARWPRSL